MGILKRIKNGLRNVSLLDTDIMRLHNALYDSERRIKDYMDSSHQTTEQNIENSIGTDIINLQTSLDILSGEIREFMDRKVDKEDVIDSNNFMDIYLVYDLGETSSVFKILGTKTMGSSVFVYINGFDGDEIITFGSVTSKLFTFNTMTIDTMSITHIGSYHKSHSPYVELYKPAEDITTVLFFDENGLGVGV